MSTNDSLSPGLGGTTVGGVFRMSQGQSTTFSFLEGGKCLIEDTVAQVIEEFSLQHKSQVEENQRLEEEVQRLKQPQGQRVIQLERDVEKLTRENKELKALLEEKDDRLRSLQMERDGLKEVVNRLGQLPLGEYQLQVSSGRELLVQEPTQQIDPSTLVPLSINVALVVDEGLSQLTTQSLTQLTGNPEEDSSSSSLITVSKMAVTQTQIQPQTNRVRPEKPRKIKLRKRSKLQLKLATAPGPRRKRRSDRTRFALRPSPPRKSLHPSRPSRFYSAPTSTSTASSSSKQAEPESTSAEEPLPSTSTSTFSTLPKKKLHQQPPRTADGNLLHCRVENHSEFDPKQRCRCGLSFPKWYHLKRHLSWFNEDYKFSCKQCDKAFFSPYHLRRHLKQAHKLAVQLYPSFGCYKCGEIFSSSRIRMEHQKSGGCGPNPEAPPI